ncbi:MAG: aspartate--tRNA(Asn) ligase [Candidatus Thorarchaeota archaeon]
MPSKVLKTFGKTHYVAELDPSMEGESVTLTGWVHRKREHGGVIFIIVRDPTGIIQIASHREQVPSAAFEDMQKVTLESSIVVTGIIVKDKRAPTGIELKITNFVIVNLADSEWPLDKDAGEAVLFDKRHLYLRSPSQTSIMQIKAGISRAAHQFFDEEGFTEIFPPVMVGASVEGGATLFPFKYFGGIAYLSQSAQLYEEAAICGLEKVYLLSPSFRAEKHRTRRHLTEYWHLESEILFGTHEDIMGVEERLVHAMVKHVKENYQPQLNLLKVKVQVPKLPFKRITYDKAIELAGEQGFKVAWGEDLGTEAERAVSKQFKVPFFIEGYPTSARSFYHMPDPERPEVTLSSDLIAPEGYGELTSGGQRIHDLDLLLQRIKNEKLDPSAYDWYLELRKFGLPPHSGFGMGLEQFLVWLLRLKHIREACLFPRTPSRIHP